VLSVPPQQVQDLLALAKSEDVEATVIGTFGTDGAQLILHYGATEVGRLAMHFLHKGIPMPMRRATVVEKRGGTGGPHVISVLDDRYAKIDNPTALKNALLRALAHPNIASK